MTIICQAIELENRIPDWMKRRTMERCDCESRRTKRKRLAYSRKMELKNKEFSVEKKEVERNF